MKTQISMFLVFWLFMLMLLALNLVLSEKEKPSTMKQTWFESGIENKFSSRSIFSVQFFLICLIFIMFDIEVVVLFSLIFKYSNWFLMEYTIQIMMFLSFILATLILEWKTNSISWKY